MKSILLFYLFKIKSGIEKDVPNRVRQKQFSELFLGRGLPIPVRGTKNKDDAMKSSYRLLTFLNLVGNRKGG